MIDRELIAEGSMRFFEADEQSRVRAGAILKLALIALISLPAAAFSAPAAYDQDVANTGSSLGYIPAPFLTDANVATVNALLNSLSSNAVRTVQIQSPINLSTANLIFNNSNYRVNFIAGGLGGSNAPDDVKSLVKQIRYINGTGGAKTQSTDAFIGNFGFQNLNNDVTNPPNYRTNFEGQPGFSGYGNAEFNNAKLNMSMAELYPGSPSYKNPAAGNSTAPNIRSALLVLPALRVSQIEVKQKSGDQNLPYVARFNNYGNLALDTDRNATNGFKFVPGQAVPAAFGYPALSASDTASQMLSRRDFATLVSHYRLRGADSYLLFQETGVEGYTQEEKRADAQKGWTEPHLDSILQASDAKLLLGKDSNYPPGGGSSNDPDDEIVIDGKKMSIESAGALFSGVYSLSLKKLDVLITNMDDEEHMLTIPDDIGGYAVHTKSFDLDGGSSLLVQYKLMQSKGFPTGWSVAYESVPFDYLPDNRDESGNGGLPIPEPASLSLAALTSFLALGRRHRRTA